MDPNTNSSTNQKSQFEQPTQWEKGTGKREERRQKEEALGARKEGDPRAGRSIVVTKKEGLF